MPDFSCQNHKALVPVHAIVEGSQGLVVFPGGEKKRRIGCDLEWISFADGRSPYTLIYNSTAQITKY